MMDNLLNGGMVDWNDGRLGRGLNEDYNGSICGGSEGVK